MSLLKITARLALASVLLFGVWHLAAVVFQPSDLVLPRPWAVLDDLWLDQDTYLRELLITAGTAYYGLIGGILLGSTLAVARVMTNRAGALVEATAVIVRTLPIVALAPLITITFGTGVSARVVIAALVSFFPVFSAIIYGTSRTDREFLLLMDLYDTTNWQRLVRFRLPASVAFITSSLPMAATLAVLGALVAEFCGSDQGLGLIVLRSLYRLDTLSLYGSVVLAGALGLTFYIAAMIPELFLGRFLHHQLQSEQTRTVSIGGVSR